MARWTELSDPGARAAFAAYFSRVDRSLAPLPNADAADIRNELEAHALDALSASDAPSAQHAQKALAQLGDPEQFLPALVTDRLRERAGRTFSPGDVASALTRNAASGIVGFFMSAAVGIGYAIAALSITLGVLKLIAPHGTGVYRLDTGELFIGADANVRGVDLLGMWFSPLAIAVGVGLYVILTWTFGRATVRKRALLGRKAMED